MSKLNIMKDKIIHDTFWWNDIEVLFLRNRLIEFYPTIDMTRHEKMNAVTRFGIYLSILLYAYNKRYTSFYVAITVMLLTLLVYKTEPIATISENYNNPLRDRNIKCVKPTSNNPFMNVLFTDPKTRPRACLSYMDNNIKKDIEHNFNKNLYRDLTDVYGKNNSQRQFYTTPITTIPNDQGSFANWLYNSEKTCKEGDGNRCSANNYTPLNNERMIA